MKGGWPLLTSALDLRHNLCHNRIPILPYPATFYVTWSDQTKYHDHLNGVENCSVGIKDASGYYITGLNQALSQDLR